MLSSGIRKILILRLIKQAWDPKNIMNPGKIFHFHATE